MNAKTIANQARELAMEGYDLVEELKKTGSTKAMNQKVSAYVKKVKAQTTKPVKTATKRKGGAA
jgi:spore coat protein CotF